MQANTYEELRSLLDFCQVHYDELDPAEQHFVNECAQMRDWGLEIFGWRLMKLRTIGHQLR